jgi:hypothetical protein
MELYTQSEVAGRARTTVGNVNYHSLTNKIPRPTVKVGRRLFYDAKGLEECMEFYKQWRPYDRSTLRKSEPASQIQAETK